jgi:hypothetical protein
VRTLQYRVLHTDEVADFVENVDGKSPRVPFEVLIALFERLPSSEQDSGDFACVVLRVKDLYEASNKWQQEMSALTKLSLRGGKRRIPVSQSPTKADEDFIEPPMIELKKVEELCEHPILRKVSIV